MAQFRKFSVAALSIYSALLVLFIAVTSLKDAVAAGEREYFYNGQYSITYLGRFVEEGTTKFCYTVCGEDVLPGFTFEGLVFEIPQCLPELEVIQCEPTDCVLGTQVVPTINGVNWFGPLHAGICQLYYFRLPGDIPEALNPAAIAVSGCSGKSCETRILPGPGCPKPHPTPTPTYTYTPVEPAPTYTPAPIPTATPVATPSPLPQKPVCDANGPYTGLDCSQSPVIVELDGSGSSATGGGELSYEWKSTCPFAEFDDPTLSNPLLAFAPIDESGKPASCEVQLTVTNVAGSSVCSAPVAVGNCIIPPDCLEVNVAEEVAGLVSRTKKKSQLVRTEVRNILTGYACGKTDRVKTFAREIILEGRRLRNEMLAFLKTIPPVIQSCPENPLCVHSDNVTAFAQFEANSAAFVQLMRKVIRMQRVCLEGGQCNGPVDECRRRMIERNSQQLAVLRQMRRLHTEIVALLKRIPTISSDCSFVPLPNVADPVADPDEPDDIFEEDLTLEGF